MKKKFEIIGVNRGLDGNGHEYLSSFLCKDSNGKRFSIDALISDCFPETEDLCQSEQVDWARKQVGKTLFTEDIASCEYVAIGKTYIL
ncbi:hypothetical protein NVP1247A_42 [Vibrio phage 1.247.A._10N.261.54.E12]|nr:hypothetical protein NVP1247A_42 [Vibrio phage 1.247.A._10N.261.54.E12]AUR98186.1 hypothetical protein NVP1247B_42 [Vibrio phage 1.247.B._10N.261.54.E12]